MRQELKKMFSEKLVTQWGLGGSRYRKAVRRWTDRRELYSCFVYHEKLRFANYECEFELEFSTPEEVDVQHENMKIRVWDLGNSRDLLFSKGY